MENNLYAFDLNSQDEYGCVIVAATTSKEASDFLSNLTRYKKFNISFNKRLIDCVVDNKIDTPKIIFKSFVEL